MRKISFVFVVLAIVGMGHPTASNAEDYYFKSKTTTAAMMGQPAKESISEVWVSPDKIKSVDSESNQSFLVRLDQGKVYSIDHDAKTYTEMPLDMFKTFAQAGMGMMQGKKDSPAKTDVTKTGKTQKVGNWNCEQVKVSHSGPMPMEIDMWVTNDVKINMNDYKKYAEAFGMEALMGDMFEKIKDIGGFPVKQTMTMSLYGMNMETVTEVVDVVVKPIQKSEFELPEGYTKKDFKMPKMPAGAGSDSK